MSNTKARTLRTTRRTRASCTASQPTGRRSRRSISSHTTPSAGSQCGSRWSREGKRATSRSTTSTSIRGCAESRIQKRTRSLLDRVQVGKPSDMTLARPEPTPTRARRRLILAICCMSLLIVGLDNTIVNVALPSLGRELHTQVAGLQWTVDAYTLVLASLLMLAGSTADRLGRRRVFQAGLALFTLGSLLCSAAPSLGWLVAFRMVQAAGGSMLNPVAMSIIRNVFTDP